MKTIKVHGAMVDLPPELRGCGTVHLIQQRPKSGTAPLLIITVATEAPMQDIVAAAVAEAVGEDDRLKQMCQQENLSRKELERDLHLMMLHNSVAGFLGSLVAPTGFQFGDPEGLQDDTRVAGKERLHVRRKDGLVALYAEGWTTGDEGPDPFDGEAIREMLLAQKEDGTRPDVQLRISAGIVDAGTQMFFVVGVAGDRHHRPCRDNVIRTLQELDPVVDPEDPYVPYQELVTHRHSKGLEAIARVEEMLKELGVVPKPDKPPSKEQQRAKEEVKQSTEALKGRPQDRPQFVLDRFVGKTGVPEAEPVSEQPEIDRRLERFMRVSPPPPPKGGED